MGIASTLNSTSSSQSILEASSLDPHLFKIILTGIISFGLFVSLFAVFGTIITIIVYCRLGFSDSTNISLVALAISDLFLSFFSGATELIYILPVLNRFMLPAEASFTTTGYAHVVFTRCSALITSFLSIERYLCVLVPLKIKRIITPRRTVVVMVFIFMISVPPVIILYFRYPLGMRYVPERNKTLFGILPISDETIYTLFFVFQAYSSNILPFATFFTVTTCTVLLSFSLRKSKTWRDANRHCSKKLSLRPCHSVVLEQEPPKENKNSSKEAKAVRMVVAIATVFIVSSIPSCVHVIVVMTVPGFDINGRYSDLFIITGNAFLVIDSINAGANVLIYYKMSTKFRMAVRRLVSPSRESSANNEVVYKSNSRRYP